MLACPPPSLRLLAWHTRSLEKSIHCSLTHKSQWLGNNRGNFYSTNHTTLETGKVGSRRYWDSVYWSNMAKYDLKSMLNYTLTVTSADTLAAYIGHSEGTIQAFAGFSLPENKELAAKVNLMVALAPVWCKWWA